MSASFRKCRFWPDAAFPNCSGGKGKLIAAFRQALDQSAETEIGARDFPQGHHTIPSAKENWLGR
jgi:hypothetical protein